MYAEARVCDEEQVDLAERGRSRIRLSPWLCAFALVAVGYGGHAVWNLGARRIGDGVVGLDLESASIKIPLTVMDIQRQLVTPPTNFDDVITKTIATKGHIAQAYVKVDTSSAFDGTDPTRTVLNVTIAGPVGVDASAIISQLNKGGDLSQLILEDLRKANTAKLGDQLGSKADVFLAAAETSTDKLPLREVDSNIPTIVLDFQVQGVNYASLTSDVDAATLQSSFADALQKDIANGLVDSKSVALDIRNGGVLNNVNYIMVTAKFPRPSSLTLKETMSKWSAGIGESIEQSLRGIASIDKVCDTNKASVIHVSSTAPHLGALRFSYTSQVQVDLQVEGELNHNNDATTARWKDTMTIVKAAIASRVGVEEKDVVVTPPAGTVADPVRQAPDEMVLHVSFSKNAQHDDLQADWEAKLLKAAGAATQAMKKKWPDASTAKAHVMTGTPQVKNAIKSADLDLVVHGIDISTIAPEKNSVFLAAFADAVRAGLLDDTAPTVTTDNGVVHGYATSNPADIVASDIDVTLSKEVIDAISVRAQIPAPADEPKRDKLMAWLGNTDELLKAVEAKLEGMSGMEYFSTWTKTGIHLSVPGTEVV